MSNFKETLTACLFAEPSPQEKAIRKLLIFDSILAQMTLDGLKKLRLVCKSWEAAARAEMLKRPENNIDFVWDQGDEAYKFYQSPRTFIKKILKKEWKPKYLDDLNQVLKTSTAFPCRYFTFTSGNIDDLSCQDFFHLQGKEIEALVLSQVEISMEYFVQLFNDELPNLKRLCLDRNGIEVPDQVEQDFYFKLPSLEVLDFEIYPPTSRFAGSCAQAMIHAATNLKAVGHLPLDNVPEEFWRSKAHLITECDIRLSRTQLEDLRRFVRAKPVLKILTVLKLRKVNQDHKSAMTKLVVQLLQSCSETLRLFRTDAFPLQPIECVMKNLTHLSLQDTIVEDGPLPVAVVAKFFPRLRDIYLDFVKKDRKKLEEYVTRVRGFLNLPGVKELSFYSNESVTTAALVRINSLFPNLHKIYFEHQIDGTTNFEISRMFGKLQKLNWIQFGSNKRFSRDQWYEALSQGETRNLLNVLPEPEDETLPAEEPELFQVMDLPL